jgi:hypothetical protein
MGGAIAQLSAAYYSHLNPWLVTLAAPSVGNQWFCDYVDKNVQPYGGLRVLLLLLLLLLSTSSLDRAMI